MVPPQPGPVQRRHPGGGAPSARPRHHGDARVRPPSISDAPTMLQRPVPGRRRVPRPLRRADPAAGRLRRRRRRGDQYDGYGAGQHTAPAANAGRPPVRPGDDEEQYDGFMPAPAPTGDQRYDEQTGMYRPECRPGPPPTARPSGRLRPAGTAGAGPRQHGSQYAGPQPDRTRRPVRAATRPSSRAVTRPAATATSRPTVSRPATATPGAPPAAASTAATRTAHRSPVAATAARRMHPGGQRPPARRRPRRSPAARRRLRCRARRWLRRAR